MRGCLYTTGFFWLADFMTELTVITVLARLELEADIIPRRLLVARDRSQFVS